MEIRIPKERFDDIMEYIQIAKEHGSEGLILRSKRDFERVKPAKQRRSR